MVIKTFEEWWYENHRGMGHEYKAVAEKAFRAGADHGMCVLSLRLVKDLKLDVENHIAWINEGGAR